MSEIEVLNKQIKRRSLERDFLEYRVGLIKKPGIDRIDALRKVHPLKDLLECLGMGRCRALLRETDFPPELVLNYRMDGLEYVLNRKEKSVNSGAGSVR
jgi:hypothetical protein